MNLYSLLIIICIVYCIPGCHPQPIAAVESTLFKAKPAENFINSLGTIDTNINKALETFHVPGAAIGIVYDNKIVWTYGYGMRNLDQRLPLTEHTLFPIASCTKAFTALILGQLVDEGKISLDDPVIQYIPELRLFDDNSTYQLTIRDLLAHRTGIARHDPIWFYFDFSRSDILDLLQNLEPACELRENFQYNNFMYALAGIVIEKVTGNSWEEEVSSRVFVPLKMKKTNTSLEQLQMSRDFSFPYAEIDDKLSVIPFRSFSPLNPAQGIHSNISEMAKWVQLQLSDGFELIHKETLQEMHTIQMPFSSSQEETEGYGLGWIIGNYRGSKWISHGGNIDGFSSEISLLPQEKMGIVILTNSSSDGPYFISSIRNIIFDKFLELEKIDWILKAQETRDQAKQTLQDICLNNQITPSSIPLQAYVGLYEHPAYGIVQISIEDMFLIASFGKSTTPLNLKTTDVFIGQFPELLVYRINPFVAFTFIRNPSGEIDQLQIPFESFRSAKPILFKRI